jgi:2-polyprenyl-6-methoxyphenol hydroxylase-like FAD-dependent oxidoreductase
MAIREAGLTEEFFKFARKEGEQMKILDNTGKVWLDDMGLHGSEGGSRPEIDRTDLRNILLNSLEPETIQWDHQLISAQPFDSSPGYVLNFANAASVNAGILIGADGAWSRVRSLITPVLPIYSGISFVELLISDVDTHFPHLASLVGQGLAFIITDNKALIPQRNSNGKMRLYAAVRVPEDWLDEHPLPSNPVDARQFVASLFKDWSSSVLDLIMSADDSPILCRNIFAFPPFLTWTTPLRSITLLGDAAHVMSPFAGEGVNLALMDAYELGKELVDVAKKGLAGKESTVAVDEGLRKYEKGMWARAQEKAEESARNLDVIFATDAPRGLVEVVKSYRPPPDDK